MESVCDFIGKKFLARIPKEKCRELTVKWTVATDRRLMLDIVKIITAAAMRKNMKAIEDW